MDVLTERLVAAVHRVIALDQGDRGGEWNVALAELDDAVDAFAADPGAMPPSGILTMTPEAIARMRPEILGELIQARLPRGLVAIRVEDLDSIGERLGIPFVRSDAV